MEYVFKPQTHVIPLSGKNDAKIQKNINVVPENTNQKKFAFGYYFRDGEVIKRVPFIALARKYTKFLKEVYFPWPSFATAREMFGDLRKKEEEIIPDLQECKRLGLQLDMLANATCYGDDAVSPKQREQFFSVIDRLGENGIMPDILTTTSPYLAQLTKENYPQIECRASVNMRLNSTLAMDYVSPYFDSFYICRDIQRDIPTLKIFSKWGKDHGKKMCMLVNSGCLRYCPWQTFHEMLLSHNYYHTMSEASKIRMQPVLCGNIVVGEHKYEEILRCSWIRPEDLWQYEPYVDVFKLSSREVSYPDLVLKAYTSRDYDGDLSKILDPGFFANILPNIIDNKRFPKEWSEGKIAGKCAINCTHCGKCTEVLKQVLVQDSSYSRYPKYSFT